MDKYVQISDQNIFKHTLITIGDTRHEPWALAQWGMHSNSQFSPLIAVNPFYQHPVAVAKRIISLKSLYPNGLALNLVAGSFFQEMERLGDSRNFEQKNEQLKEFYEALMALLSQKNGATYQGQYYKFTGVQIFPRPDFAPISFFISGAFAEDTFAQSDKVYFVRNARPKDSLQIASNSQCGLALGICARDSRENAEAVYKKLFPDDRKGQMLFDIASKNKLTPWNQWLHTQNKEQNGDSLYNLSATKNFWSSAPYLVGSYTEVRAELAHYRKMGYGFFILDYHPQDLDHVRKCLDVVDGELNP